MRSPTYGKPRSAARSTGSLSGRLPKLKLPSTVTPSAPRRRPQVNKPSAGKSSSDEHVSLPRNERK